MKTLFCPHACDSEPEGVLSRYILHTTHNQTGLGEKRSQKIKDCIFVRSENTVGKASGVSFTEGRGWTELLKSNCIVHSVFTQRGTPGNTEVTHLGPICLS